MHDRGECGVVPGNGYGPEAAEIRVVARLGIKGEKTGTGAKKLLQRLSREKRTVLAEFVHGKIDQRHESRGADGEGGVWRDGTTEGRAHERPAQDRRVRLRPASGGIGLRATQGCRSAGLPCR